MAQPKKKKVRRKVKVKTGAKIKKKDSVKVDTLPKAKTQMPRNAGPTFKIKIKKKK